MVHHNALQTVTTTSLLTKVFLCDSFSRYVAIPIDKVHVRTTEVHLGLMVYQENKTAWDIS